MLGPAFLKSNLITCHTKQAQFISEKSCLTLSLYSSQRSLLLQPDERWLSLTWASGDTVAGVLPAHCSTTPETPQPSCAESMDPAWWLWSHTYLDGVLTITCQPKGQWLWSRILLGWGTGMTGILGDEMPRSGEVSRHWTYMTTEQIQPRL